MRRRSEVVAQRRQMGDEADFVAADGNKQSIPVGMLVDVAREFLRSNNEGEFRIGGIAECP